MISADKARIIAKQAQFNLYDSQLRLLFEGIEDSAKGGNMSFSFHSWECKDTFFDESFWFSGAVTSAAAISKSHIVLKKENWNCTKTYTNENGEFECISFHKRGF